MLPKQALNSNSAEYRTSASRDPQPIQQGASHGCQLRTGFRWDGRGWMTSMARDRDAAPDQARDHRAPAGERRSSASTGGRSPVAEVRERAWMRCSGSATKQLRAPPTTRTSTSIPPPLAMAAFALLCLSL